MRRTFLGTCCAALLGLTASAGEAPRSCCAKPQAADTASAFKMKCSITGKVVEKCCCSQKEGKTYCALAKKAVEKCCCSPVEGVAQPEEPI